jgi:hypothetical protein
MHAAEIQRLNERVARFTSLHISLVATVSEQIAPDLTRVGELVNALREDTPSSWRSSPRSCASSQPRWRKRQTLR